MTVLWEFDENTPDNRALIDTKHRRRAVGRPAVSLPVLTYPRKDRFRKGPREESRRGWQGWLGLLALGR